MRELKRLTASVRTGLHQHARGAYLSYCDRVGKISFTGWLNEQLIHYFASPPKDLTSLGERACQYQGPQRTQTYFLDKAEVIRFENTLHARLVAGEKISMGKLLAEIMVWSIDQEQAYHSESIDPFLGSLVKRRSN